MNLHLTGFFFTTTEPDGKIVESKVKAATTEGIIPYFENLINISGKKWANILYLFQLDTH